MRRKSSLKKDEGGPVVVMIQFRRMIFVLCPRCRDEIEIEDEVIESLECGKCDAVLLIDQKDGHNVDEDEDIPLEDNFDDEGGGRGTMDEDIEFG